MVEKYPIKSDKYSRARGGNSIHYSLSCADCGEFLLIYQKDGIGNMLRLYLDRIIAPENLANLQESKSKSDFSSLKCAKCGLIIGIPMVYASEKRLAFRLIRGKVKKDHLS